MQKFGAWYDEDWFQLAIKDKSYNWFIDCKNMGGDIAPHECMEELLAALPNLPQKDYNYKRAYLQND